MARMSHATIRATATTAAAFLAPLALLPLVAAAVAAQEAVQEPTTQDATTAPAEGEGEGEGADGTQTDALVNQMLDAPVQLDVASRPLPEVLEAVTRETGVPFFVGEATYALLPYGRQTPVGVKVNATPLRQTLAAVAQKLGLDYDLAEQRVELRPVPALSRAGRRATVQEIAMLDLLAGVRLDLVDDRPTAAQLLEEVDLKLQGLDAAAAEAGRAEPGFVVENRLDDALRRRPVYVQRDATLLRAMEAIHEQTAATWYPWGDTLVVVPKDAWVRRMLEQPVDLRYEQVDLGRALRDLEAAAGVPFRIEPGALGRVPEGRQRVQLTLDGATVREALDSLGGYTGLGYAVEGDGIYLWNADTDGRGARRDGRPGRFGGGAGVGGPVELPVLSVDMGDGTSLLVYPDDLPEDLRARLDDRRRAAVDALRDGGQGDPTTRPGA